MVRLYSNVGLRFYIPDGGGGSGGGGGAGAASSASGGQQNGNTNGGGGGSNEPIKTPFDDLPWDELGDEDRTKFEKAKADYVATLQQSQKATTDLQKTVDQARQFQSRADRLEAELKRWKPSEEPKDDPYLTAVTEELRQAGYPEAEAVKMAPVFAGMFKRVGVIERKAIGNELAPLAGTVLAQEAESAFQNAYAQDAIGMLQIPEVATTAWEHVKARAESGQNTTPEIVLNLAKMAYVDHIADKQAKGEEVPVLRATLSATPPIPGMRTGMYPGSGRVISTAPPIVDPNAARTTLNEDTRQALAATFRQMAPDLKVFPKAFTPAATGRAK